MKRLLILFLFVIFAITINAQGLFKPVPEDLFQPDIQTRITPLMGAVPQVQTIIPGKWILRLNTGVMGVSYELKKGSVPVPLSAILFGIGYLYYENVNGTPFNVWGVNAGLLTNTQNAGLGLGLFGTYNTNAIGLLNVGGHYDFSVNMFYIDTGLSFKF